MGQVVRLSGKSNRVELTIVAFLIVVFSVLTFFWASYRGALGVARNDDWVYLHMAQWFSQTGQFQVESGSMTNALGLVILAQPVISVFGYSVEVLQILEIIVGAVGIYFTWIVLRTFLSKLLAFIAISTLVSSPFWASATVSFMTDVPAYTFQIIALWLAIKAFQTKKFNAIWLSSAFLVSFFAFSIREYSIASGIAIACFFFFAKKSTSNKLSRNIVPIFLIWLVACFILYFWRSQLGNVTHFRGVLDSAALKEASIQAIRAFTMVGLFLIPALLVSSPRKIFSRLSIRKNLIALFPPAIFLVAMWQLFKLRGLVFGNYFTPRGSYVETFPLGKAPNIVPPPLFEGISWLGVLAVAYLVWALSAWLLSKTTRRNFFASRKLNLDNPVWIVIWFCAITLAALTIIPLFTNAPLFDRYFFPILPLLAAVVLYVIEKHKLVWQFGKLISLFSILCIALMSSVFIDSSFILDGLKWKSGNALSSEGYSSETIDAGYEWFGYHQKEIASGANIRPIRNWWISLYDSPEVCASVGIGEVDAGAMGQPVLHSFQVDNFIGTKFNVWSIEANPGC